MDSAPWWLLIAPFLLFGLGWIAARIDIGHLLTESRSLPTSYFKGLNFLLNEQPDRAIDAFIEVVKLDPETIELHFALGNLFRRRGETERAIRMHQNLLSRPDLPAEQRGHAMFELGQDYLKAGLLDRAEESFRQLSEGSHATEAKRHLLEIFQLEKEWHKAIEAAEELQASGAGSNQVRIAQFHCELAQTAMNESRLDDAQKDLEAALAANRRSVRALVLLGDVDVQKGQDEQAIAVWKKVEQQSAPHVALVGERLIDAYRRLGRFPEGLKLIKSYLDAYPSIDLLEVVLRATTESDGPEAANALAREALHRSPSLLALGQYLDTRSLLATPNERDDLEVVKNLIHNHTRRIGRYICSNCGFKARQFHWQCPGCTHWESYPPRRSEELENQNQI
ncbi:MAG: lipopolysaccharide assembly protein LapB [Burkholderiaceae bacterium]|jgi:lipopolysaccharide biosynthesis regulator YciM